MEELIEHTPEDLPAAIECSICKEKSPIPWLETRKNPFVPVYPNDYHPVNNNKIWIPSGLEFLCRSCQNPLYLKLPRVKKRGQVHLFGDEAYSPESLFFTYTLAGAAPQLLPEIESDLHKLKRKFEPDLDPTAWVIHMKDMWSQDNRRRHPIFKNWSFQKVQDLVSSLNDVIKSSNNNLFLFNIAISNKYSFNKTTIERYKLKTYCNFIFLIVEYLTSKGAQPHIFFDSEKPSNVKYKVHQWAKDVFQNSQRKLLYTYISRGIEIPEPLFIKPASHPCSEIADHVSYWIRRYHLDQESNKVSFVDPREFGTVIYFGFSNTGNIIQQRQIGYPWDVFYGRK